MTLEELESKVEAMEKELTTLKDIEAIRKLENAYGYYLINFMNEELIDCFSDSPETTLEWPEGTFLGKDGVKRFFGYINKDNNPEFMHQMMQLSGIVTVEPDGRTAKGRWWGFGAMAIPAGSMEIPGGEGVDQAIACGIYEMGYIKVEDVWKISKIKWVPVYAGAPGEGWVKPERVAAIDRKKMRQPMEPDRPRTFVPGYPSGYIVPFHFKHPVTGKASTEAQRNATLNIQGNQ